MGVSFYLKSLVVGMNNNSIPLTRDQIYLSSLQEVPTELYEAAELDGDPLRHDHVHAAHHRPRRD